MATDPSKKILIVGGGIAGLTLAQILRANDIPYEVFERDEAPSSRNQGWSVALMESLPGLDAALPKDLGDLETVGAGYAAGVPDSMALWNIKEGKIVANFGGVPKGEPGWALRAYRPRLREFLWPKINVKTNKRFKMYTEDDTNNTITAHFEDGTSATGGLLVGADGAFSRVRHQLLGDEGPQPRLGEYQNIIGLTEMSKEQYENYSKFTTSTIACPGQDVMGMVATVEVRADRSARAMWAVNFKSDDPAAHVAWLRSASKESKYKQALEKARRVGFPPPIMDTIENSCADEIPDQAFVFTEFLTPTSLPEGRITFVGDALHTMLPFKGAGANTAIRDACELATILIDGQRSGASVEAMRRQYEDVALPRGRETVLESSRIVNDPGSIARVAATGRITTMSEKDKAEQTIIREILAE